VAKIPRASGIYQIRCIPTGKIYVGSAVNMRARWIRHRWELRRSIHGNEHLQSGWDKYGEDSFECSVLEFAERYALLSAEQAWLDRTRCFDRSIGFNISSTAGSPGTILAKVWEGFIDPDGNEMTITNLQEFCRQHDLDHPSMIRLAQGKSKLKSYKGWTHKSSIRKRAYIKTYEGFIDPEGHAAGPITNLAAFCRTHGLDTPHMVAVAHGRLISHRSWTYDTGRQRITTIHTGFISPAGERVEIVNLAAFRREQGLSVVHMHNVKSGQRRSHKGWTWRAADESPA